MEKSKKNAAGLVEVWPLSGGESVKVNNDLNVKIVISFLHVLIVYVRKRIGLFGFVNGF